MARREPAVDAEGAASAAAGPDGADGQFDEAAIDAFRAAMDDDLGTPQGVAVVFDTLRRANTALDAGTEDAPKLAATVRVLARVLGIPTHGGQAEVYLGASSGVLEAVLGAEVVQASNAAIEDLVARRQAARDTKDWVTADSLREELSALGVVVEDTPAGPIWHRT